MGVLSSPPETAITQRHLAQINSALVVLGVPAPVWAVALPFGGRFAVIFQPESDFFTGSVIFPQILSDAEENVLGH